MDSTDPLEHDPQVQQLDAEVTRLVAQDVAARRAVITGETTDNPQTGT